MRNGKYRILILELLLTILLFFALFASRIVIRWVLAIGLVILMLILRKNYRLKSNDYIYSKQVNILLVIFGVLYIVIFYASGLYFGFTKAKFILSLWTMVRFIIPFTLIIIASEYIRKSLLSQEGRIKIKGRKYDLSAALTYIIMILIDLIIYTGIYNLNELDNILTSIGFVLFASVSCNLLYNYITRRFGYRAIIYYRLITVLFIYIIPVTPDVFIFFRSFFRMVYPFIIYLVLSGTYAKAKSALSRRTQRNDIITTSVNILLLSMLVALISCQFRYGIIVIGSESMTGTIDKGDAIIYSRYNGGPINEGQVVMFNQDGFRIIHRVIKRVNVDGEIRYITKGDANKTADDDYRRKEDITGLINIKIKKIGIPTLWLRSLFEKDK